jgi:hypothetical protein
LAVEEFSVNRDECFIYNFAECPVSASDRARRIRGRVLVERV